MHGLRILNVSASLYACPLPACQSYVRECGALILLVHCSADGIARCESYQFVDSHICAITLPQNVRTWLDIKHLGNPKTVKYLSYRIRATVHVVWSLVAYAFMNLVKWSTTMRFPGISILTKSIWTKSTGSVASMGVSFGVWTSALKMRHYLQFLRAKADSFAIPAHQNRSFSKLSIQSRPWCPMNRWHPSKAALHFMRGTIKASTSSWVLEGVIFKYNIYCWMTKSFWRSM